jgi:hypothetical protein
MIMSMMMSIIRVNKCLTGFVILFKFNTKFKINLM